MMLISFCNLKLLKPMFFVIRARRTAIWIARDRNKSSCIEALMKLEADVNILPLPTVRTPSDPTLLTSINLLKTFGSR